MTFRLPLTHLPHNRALLASLGAAAERLGGRLAALDVGALDISDYNRRYLLRKVTGAENLLRKMVAILAWALAPCQRPLEDIRLVDYGAGSGMLGLLAKEARVGTVIYNDIYDVSCRDAPRIAGALDVALDHYVEGDLSDLVRYLQRHRLVCDVMVSSDVIEHIYDLEAFMQELGAMPADFLSLCMATDANPLNPLRKRSIVKLQRAAEYTDRKAEWGHKKRDALRSYLVMRRDMISAQAPQIGCQQVEELASRTRGLMQQDIRAAVDRLLCTGELPLPPTHPTNTCDPRTGNWQERLVHPYLLRDMLAGAEFDARVQNGFYGEPRSAGKRQAARLLNRAIMWGGRLGTHLAPFFALCGTRTGR